MCLSVWGRKTHEVLMLTYLILIVWLGIPLIVMIVVDAMGGRWPNSTVLWIFDSVKVSNPFFLVYAPYWSPGNSGHAAFFWHLRRYVLCSRVLVALAAWRIRAVAIKQAGKVTRPHVQDEVWASPNRAG